MRIAIASSLVLFIAAGCASAGSRAEDEPPTASGAAESKGENSSRTGDTNGSDTAEERTPPEGFSDSEVLDVVSTVGGSAVLLTKSPSSQAEVVVPIFVGRSQAHAIELRLERRRASRPMTHDLLDNLVDRLGGEIVKVHIGAIKSGVFVGTVFVEQEGATMQVDSRSSDAIALALGNRVPIFVAESVFEKAGISKKKLERRGLNRNPGMPRPRKRREGDESAPPKEGESSGEEGPFL